MPNSYAFLALAVASFLFVSACGGGGASSGASPSPTSPSPATSSPAPSSAWLPQRADTFQWDLRDTPAITTVNASVYDIDLFGNDAAVVTALHQAGRHVVCYIDFGALEPYRPDTSLFPPVVLGKVDAQWGETYLDIRRLDIVGPLMSARLDQCKAKGFDAVEPDLVDTYAAGASVTGFALTANDQLTYNRWIAAQAHSRGLSVALKNDADQATDLVSSFDWALAEDCLAQNWCGKLAPFASANKVIVDVEYTDVTPAATFINVFCPQASRYGLYEILKHRNLDSWLTTCP